MVDTIAGLPIHVGGDVSISRIVVAIVDPQGSRVIWQDHCAVFVDIHVVFAISPLQPFQPGQDLAAMGGMGVVHHKLLGLRDPLVGDLADVRVPVIDHNGSAAR